MRIRDRRQRGEITAQGLVGLLGLFAGLCSVFAAVVTIADAWREHTEAGWPETIGKIQKCSVDPYYPFRRQGPRIVWHITCRISYEVDAEEISATIRSRSASPGRDVTAMHRWVAQHRPETAIDIRYDPSDHKKAVLTATDMPYAGPRTPDNLRLLLIAAGSCVVLITIARLMGRRTSELPPG